MPPELQNTFQRSQYMYLWAHVDEKSKTFQDLFLTIEEIAFDDCKQSFRASSLKKIARVPTNARARKV